MRVKMILPALTEAASPFFRPIKYSLFPPLGLATLAGYLAPDDEVTLQDEHVEKLDLDDAPDLVVIQVYITSAYRAYELADHYRRRGAYVCLGGLHVTSLPEEAAAHADTIFMGPGEDTWPGFLADFRARRPGRVYRSTLRTLAEMPRPRRDLIKRWLYLVPNSIVVSRGCPYSCDFCYKDAFFEGGRSFYTQTVDTALSEIERLPGRHLYFLDDNLFGDPRFATALFAGMRGMGRLWQAAATVNAVLRPGLLEAAVAAGLRSLFVGFETLSPANLQTQHKLQNLGRDYAAAIRRLHDHGVMINGSFVFGMDDDDATVFDRTVGWAVEHGIETATFHILTPYPGTALHQRIEKAGRITSRNWDLYDTRHVVFRPARLAPGELEAGYWRAYREFYSWKAITRSAWVQDGWAERLRHLAYAGGWKKCEPLWDVAIRARRVTYLLPLLESVLNLQDLTGFLKKKKPVRSSPILLRDLTGFSKTCQVFTDMTPSAAPGIRFGWVTVRLLAFSALPLALAVARIVKTGHLTHGFVFWNLFLAWLPLGFAYLALRSRPAALRLVFASLWLLFLPNAPYLVTDLIHLRPANDIPILYDVVLLFSAALSGVALGAVSLHWMQAGVARVLGRWPSRAFVLAALVAAGFGVYLGRFLRWNSWDAILRPTAVAQDILDPLLHPVAHWQTWALTLLFAAVLACAYWLPSLFTGLKPEEN